MSMPLRESQYPQGHLHPIVLMYDFEHGHLFNTDALASITRPLRVSVMPRNIATVFISIETPMNAEDLVGFALKAP